MPFAVSCPFCPTKLGKLPDGAAGASVRCPKCGNYFTAAPADEPLTSVGSMRFGARQRPKRMAAVEHAAPVATMQVAQTDRASFYQPKIDPEIDPPSPPQPRAIDPLGLGGLCLGGAALLGASFAACADYVVPASSLGFFVGLVGVLRCRAKSKGRLLQAVAGTLVSGLVLLAALFQPALLGPAFQAARQRDTADSTAIRAVPLAGSHATVRTASAGWVDATQGAFQQGSRRIHVGAVWVGPSGKSRDRAGAQHLFVRLHLQDVEKTSAFAANNPQLSLPRPKDVRPRLMDGGGKTYAYEEAVDVAGLENVRTSTVFPMTLRDEVLVFAPPKAGIAYLRLEVPAAAGSSFRFTIPAKMIHWKKTGDE